MIKLFSKKSSIWFWLIIALFIIGHFLGLWSILGNKTGQLTGPIISSLTKNNQVIGTWFNDWRQRDSCQEKLHQAENKINQLTIDSIGLSGLLEENQNLRQLLSFQQSRNFKMVTANIIYRGQAGGLLAPGQTLIIDRGSNQGITADLVVIDQRGAVVGKIGQVRAESAEVLLVTNKNCRLAVATAGGGTIGVARGDLGLTIRLELVPQNEFLQEDQEIVTSGLEPAVPKDLLIGRISQITKENNALWQDADIEPAVNVNQLSFVSVIIP